MALYDDFWSAGAHYCPTVDHPRHRGPVPLWNTLLTVDLPTVEYPIHLGPAHRGTPYSPWTFPWSRGAVAAGQQLLCLIAAFEIICNVVFKAKIGRKVFVMPCCDRF